MDHDAMHRDVGNLKKFRDRAEKAIAFVEGLQHAGFNPEGGAAPKLNEDQVAQVREQFSEIIRPVSDQIDIKLNSFDDRLKSLERAQNTSSLVAIEDRLKALETSKGLAVADMGGDFEERLSAVEKMLAKDGESFPEGLSDLKEMVEWFKANREGLEVLLSLDGEPDQADPLDTSGSTTGTADSGVAGSAGAGGSVAGAEAGSGAAVSETGTNGGPANPAPLDAPVAELNNEPSARAEAAVAEPAAGTDKV